MTQIYYVDGEYVPADQAVIPVDDLAIVRGIGVFDLLRTYGGKPYFLKEHVNRLFDSAGKIDLVMPWSRQQVCEVVLETLSRNQFSEANARIIVTGGSSPDFMTPQGESRLIVMVTPLPELPRQWLTQGANVITFRINRNFAGTKNIDYLSASIALRQAREKDAMEAIYIDSEGLALEGTTSNLFVFIKERLVTPGKGVLSGITRKAVLALAENAYSIEVRDLLLNELLTAQEVFITGTNKGLVPVVRIDDTVIGDGRPGPRTLQLMNLLETYTRQIT